MSVISYTAAEWIYLAALLRVPALVGFADPFAGQAAREVEVALFRARLSLSERKVIEVAPDGRVVVAPWAAELVALCTRPEATLAIPGGPRSRYYHLVGSRAVEQTVHRESGQVDLVELPGGAGPVSHQVAAGLLDGDSPVEEEHPTAPGSIILRPAGGPVPRVELMENVGRLVEQYPYFFKR